MSRLSPKPKPDDDRKAVTAGLNQMEEDNDLDTEELIAALGELDDSWDDFDEDLPVRSMDEMHEEALAMNDQYDYKHGRVFDGPYASDYSNDDLIDTLDC